MTTHGTGPVNGREDGVLRTLSQQLSDPCLKSSTRILILVSLAINTRLGFLDLLHLTGMGKGSLSNHLEKLETAGYVTTRRIMVWGGRRVMVQITPKGRQVYSDYMQAMNMLNRAKNDVSQPVEKGSYGPPPSP